MSSLMRVATLKSARLGLPKLPSVTSVAAYHGRALIGKREVVGYGFNGEYAYHDKYDCPFPAIRFKETTGEIAKLKEKEKGDWKNLTLDEKKKLYRASFCQTYAEMNAPTGDWKVCTSVVLAGLAVTLWYYIWCTKYVLPDLPASFSQEAKDAQLKRMIDLRVNRITGLASKWDYEKNQWKE